MYRIHCLLITVALLLSSTVGGPLPALAAHGTVTRCDAVAVAQSYLSDLQGHSFRAMWDLLIPATRRPWRDVNDFVRYEGAKFASLRSIRPTLHTLDVSGSLKLWVHLGWGSATPQNEADSSRLLASTPLRVAVSPAGHCAVVDPGPTAPGTPLVVPLHAAISVVRVPILMYHDVSSRPPRTSLQYGLTVADRDFADQLTYLCSHGYHTISLIQLFEHLYYGRGLPPRPVILTFDDGYDNAYSDAFPLLRRFGDVGVFNVITGKVGLLHDGLNSYATWDQLRAMLQAGMEIESHTVYHEDLRIVSRGVAWNELRYARATLRARLGVPAQFLTYPAGEPFRSGSATAQASVLALARRAGYVGALLDQPVASTLQQAARPYQLPRIRVAGGAPLSTFIAGLNS